MPQVATPNLIEVVCQINGAVGTGPHYNIYHFVGTSTPSTSAADAIPLLKTFYTALNTYYHTGTTITVGYKVIDRTTVPWKFVAATAQSVSGTASAGVTAAQLAAVVSWRSAAIGRSYRGRTYIGPLDNQASAGSAWSGAFATALQNAANAMIAAAGPTSVEPCVYSHIHNTTSLITSAGANSIMRTLRSRAY